MIPKGTEKIHKVLANLGYGSRREIEDLIRLGKVAVDGEPATIGMRINPGQRVRLNDSDVVWDTLIRQVLVYNKPTGQEVTRTPRDGCPSVFESLPKPGTGKWMNIGRLDVETEGLLLFTNDGGYCHLLSHPTGKAERRYRVRVSGRLEDKDLEVIRSGNAMVGDRPLKVVSVSRTDGTSGRNAWYSISIEEGRNRIVRRLFGSFGLEVSRLIRVGFGSLDLPEDLRRGGWRELTQVQIERLAGEALAARRKHSQSQASKLDVCQGE